MKGSRYTAEFKAEAVKQIIERGRGVVEVAHDVATLKSEVSQLKAELRRTQEERDILKNSPRGLPRPLCLET